MFIEVEIFFELVTTDLDHEKYSAVCGESLIS